ncbi:MAG TPA: flagellar basal body P-ring formation chaperone FlgA [Rhodopila sp.]|uniref:flagellar basal body P-ring formation chaperone FlgA n=1 Tax=Rhodopila sp. TaxID=2480087 RepID=UPI002BFB7232|nr:flagellar basal body P-ring formation chaperone FlgA [Rhodopila sp.]HVY17753.1 flagellar basal body P-ring formation chaperone FlgA [Rhodopila sp.]
MKRLVLAGLAACACQPALAASLRGVTTLHGPVVYLHDLFDDAGPNADRALGPGPAPGDRIVVEAAQLNAIARQFDVPWRSVSSADRSVLEWPGRPLRQEEAVDAVKAAITATGASDDIDIDIPGFVPPMVPVDASVSAAVSQLDYDPNTGRFTAALTVTGETMNALSTRISGKAEPMASAMVAVTRLLPDTILRADDVKPARIRASRVPEQPVVSADQVVGMQLRHPLVAGQPLRLADLMRPPLVQRGALVRMELSDRGLTVSAEATAIDDGAEGERIRVQNVNSRNFVYADVVGPDRVRVVPGAVVSTLPARFDRRMRTP